MGKSYTWKKSHLKKAAPEKSHTGRKAPPGKSPKGKVRFDTGSAPLEADALPLGHRDRLSWAHRSDGPVIEELISNANQLGLKSWSSFTSDLPEKLTLPDAWRYENDVRAGWPGVSVVTPTARKTLPLHTLHVARTLRNRESKPTKLPWVVKSLSSKRWTD